jgi:alkylhydroperoxidase family enzyme
MPGLTSGCSSWSRSAARCSTDACSAWTCTPATPESSARPNGRIYLLGAWRETDLYSEQERAALALTDAMTRLSETQDVPDEVYDRAVSVFTEDQYRAVAWTITAINAFNRLGVTSRWKLPPEPQ